MTAKTINHQGGALHNTTGPSPKALKVALYARVSVRYRAQSLETQIQILRDIAKQRGMEVVLEVTETVSGAAPKLPKRDALPEKLRWMGINVVMVTYLDRFGRCKVDVLNLLAALEKVGVNFISVRDNVDYSTPAGKMEASRLAGIAEFERDRIKNRTRDGRAAAMLKGIKFGRPRKLDDDTVREIAMALDMGKTQKNLGKQYGVTQGTIYRINKKRKHPQQQGAAEPLDGPQLQDEKDESMECRPQFADADAAKIQRQDCGFLMRRLMREAGFSCVP